LLRQFIVKHNEHHEDEILDYKTTNTSPVIRLLGLLYAG